jgi:DNA-directed RNA polymerase subunit RPC12/RpoP
MLKCRHCGSTNYTKAGLISASKKQAYKCKDCKRYFSAWYDRQFVSATCPTCGGKAQGAGEAKNGKEKTKRLFCPNCKKTWRTQYCQMPEKRQLRGKLEKMNDVGECFKRYVKRYPMTLAEFVDYVEFVTDKPVINGKIHL